MGICFFGLAGDCGSSQTVETKKFNSIINSTVNEMINTTQTTSNTKVINLNNYEITTGENSDVEYCDIFTTQSINSTQSATINVATSDVTSLQQQLKDTLTNTDKQSSTTKQELLSLSQSSGVNLSEIHDQISNAITTRVTKQTLTAINSIIDLANKNKLAILGKWRCGPSGKIESIQGILSSQVSNIIVNSLLNNTQSVDNAVDITNSSGITQDLSQKGIGDAGAKIISSVTNPLASVAIAWIVGGVILALIIGLFIFFILRKPSTKSVSFGKRDLKALRKIKF
jgi:hypothetical protein